MKKPTAVNGNKNTGLQKDSNKGMAGLVIKYERFTFSNSPTKRAEIYEMLAALIKDGKPLDAAVRALRNRYKEVKRPMASMLTIWLSRMAEGKPFGDSIKGYAVDAESTIISASDKSGDLYTGLMQAAKVARTGAQIRAVLVEELRTPFIQMFILISILIGFSTGLAPELTKSVPMWAMDEMQVGLFTLCDFVAQTWFIAVPAIVVFLIFLMWTVPRYHGPMRPYLDKIPPYSIFRTYSSATFMISLSALINAGVPIESSLRFIRDMSRPWAKQHLTTMIGRLNSGSEQGHALDTGMLSDKISDMVAIYSSTADFAAAVNTMGDEANKDGVTSIKRQAGVAKSMVTIMIACMVGWMMLSVIGIGDASLRASRGGGPTSIKAK